MIRELGTKYSVQICATAKTFVLFGKCTVVCSALKMKNSAISKCWVPCVRCNFNAPQARNPALILLELC